MNTASPFDTDNEATLTPEHISVPPETTTAPAPLNVPDAEVTGTETVSVAPLATTMFPLVQDTEPLICKFPPARVATEEGAKVPPCTCPLKFKLPPSQFSCESVSGEVEETVAEPDTLRELNVVSSKLHALEAHVIEERALPVTCKVPLVTVRGIETMEFSMVREMLLAEMDATVDAKVTLSKTRVPVPSSGVGKAEIVAWENEA